MYDKALLLNELSFKAVRSSGSGGQHVNKVSSKIELSFDLLNSFAFTDDVKQRVINKLQNRLTKEGVFILQCDESRSQIKNKSIIIKRFLELIANGLKEPKKRKPTKIPKSIKLKRQTNKKQLSEKKANRKPPKI